ncbi:MAG: hypothetical protein Ct9H300mP6_03700 [Gammaproteobacteria bacterium]|nr:MAG: hypothetical protein Ct9H300mP6_03700 [Gammaproteobacteria bacterium]
MGIKAEGSGSSYIDNGVYYSDIEIPINFEKEQIKALESGIIFNLELNLKIVDIRNWRLDRDIGDLNPKIYAIEFNAFTRRYTVSKRTLGGKLHGHDRRGWEIFKGPIKKLPLVDDSLLDLDADYTVILDSRLRAQGMSPWMKTISFWRESLDSDLEQIQWQLFR